MFTFIHLQLVGFTSSTKKIHIWGLFFIFKKMKSMSQKVPHFPCFQNLCVPKKGFSFQSLGKIGSEINTTAIFFISENNAGFA